MRRYAGLMTRRQAAGLIGSACCNPRSSPKLMTSTPAHVLRRWLAEDRYDGPGVVAQWAARGWLALPPSGKGHDKPVKVNGQPMRCVCLLRDAVEAAMADGSAE